ncbi:Reverse transcriptase (RNA-dependent DNA polymerase) [Fragilaria crotonensis]|nr:Reverse transcriptase (RNA-dependent DNA polymerase) [Fragilaria crotonensis]
MADHDNIEKWLKAANDEIQSLQKNGTWIEVPITEAKTRILPGTWVFRRKRTPDGTISKYKARYCRVRSSPAFGSSLDPFASWIPLSERPRHVPATPEKPLWLEVAPRLWYQHLSEALREEGFKACANDPCLLYKDTIMVVLYVDDLGIAYRDQNDLDKLFANLEAKSLTFTREGTFTDFLGINFTRDTTNGTLR